MSASAASTHGQSSKLCSGAMLAGVLAGSGRVVASAGVAAPEAELDGVAVSGGGRAVVEATSVGGCEAVFAAGGRALCRASATLGSGAGAAEAETAGAGVAARFLDEGAGGEGWSAGRVTVPDRLKFCSSLGPIASVAGVLVVESDVLCASAAAGPSTSPAAKTAIAERLPALMSSCPIVR